MNLKLCKIKDKFASQETIYSDMSFLVDVPNNLTDNSKLLKTLAKEFIEFTKTLSEEFIQIYKLNFLGFSGSKNNSIFFDCSDDFSDDEFTLEMSLEDIQVTSDSKIYAHISTVDLDTDLSVNISSFNDLYLDFDSFINFIKVNDFTSLQDFILSRFDFEVIETVSENKLSKVVKILEGDEQFLATLVLDVI